MPLSTAKRNRGPAAASANRAAILEAARRLFAEQGYRVPLNAIARAAGVGQGVLYRHFPSRLHLAYAVFADNFAGLERLAAETPGPECFHVLWRGLVAHTVESTAFVDMVIDDRNDLPAEIDLDRLEKVLAEPLARAKDAGLVEPTWTTGDVVLLLHMVHGVVIAQPEQAAVSVERALSLIDPRLTSARPTTSGEPAGQ